MVSMKIPQLNIREQLQEVEKHINSSIDNAKAEITKLVIDYAKLHHKFDSKSGNLERAIKVKDGEGGLEFYLDYKMAEYANFIVTGVRKVNGRPVKAKVGADNFLEEAVMKNETEIINILKRYING